ncbi:ABC transporter permease [Pyrococcus abyssi]|uniref:DppB-1 dipeptide transport system permease protein dppB or oligopeptide transport system permease protein oppB n=1 Tax=Pyrococcus abyssi (strain GE5 / Orsay) TaxID=272844 RepID=Q9UXV8_PYRAB|nr:ABC transporter permease [Pyrococcus abyssi]CAB50655.1 dppB-1 dipeptide transport system permease protein dppB or oligopeptide transport system permease protein oppB [Pyrococcus abyssi GE5]CCE71224.1 TPA: oligopeptide transport permease protein appb [Pyrococcus abyssi GE5]
MGYGRYLAYRLTNAFIVLLIVTFVVSILFTKVADDMLRSSIQEQINMRVRTDPELQKLAKSDPHALEEWKKREYDRLLKAYGLDRPFWVRVIDRTKKTMMLDFGDVRSPIFGETSVRKIIAVAIPRTVMLFTTASLIVMFLGIMLGLKAAQKAGGLFDRGLSVFAMVTTSIPMWWFGMILILLFSFKLNLLPSGGMTSIPPKTGFAYYTDVLKHMILPLTTIVFVSFGGWAWVTRNIMIGVLQEDFIMAARAKGVPENKVIYGHALRAAAPPIITMTIFTLLGSLGGAILTESVFNWPGMGRLYWVAIQQMELNLIMGSTYISVALYLIGVLLADLAYGFLDPRVKVGVSQRL